MKIYSYIQPRQVGKTTLAVYEYLKDPDNTLFIVPNSQMVYNVEAHFLIHKNDIKTPYNLFSRGVHGKIFNKIILDEYCFMENKKEWLPILISQLNPKGEIYIFSTPNKQYSKFIWNCVTECKKSKLDPSEIFEKYYPVFKYKPNKEQFWELYYDLLTHPDNKLFKEKLSIFKYPDQTRLDELKYMFIKPEQFKLEYLNDFLTDPKIEIKFYI